MTYKTQLEKEIEESQMTEDERAQWRNAGWIAFWIGILLGMIGTMLIGGIING